MSGGIVTERNYTMKRFAVTVIVILWLLASAPSLILLALSRLCAWLVSPFVAMTYAITERFELDGVPAHPWIEKTTAAVRRFVD